MLVYQDVIGNRYILYPDTEQQRRTKLLANKQYFSGAEKLPLEVSCNPACGTEMVWAFASEKPVDISGTVMNLSGSGLRGYPASDSLANILRQQRGIKRSEKKAEARVYLTTVPKEQ